MTRNQNHHIWPKIIIGGFWGSFRAILMLREASPNFLTPSVYNLQVASNHLPQTPILACLVP